MFTSSISIIFAGRISGVQNYKTDAEQQEEALKRAFLYHMHDETSAWVGALLLWIVCSHDTLEAFLDDAFARHLG
jgi:hypothetical protein